MVAIYPSAGAPSNGTDEVQTITFGGTPTGGTFKLEVAPFTTAAISWSATNNTLRDNVDAALEALPNIGTGNVTTAVGTMTLGIGTLTVTFTGALAKKAVSLITVPAAGLALTGTLPTVVVTETTPGVTATHRGAAVGALLKDTTTGELYSNQGTVYAPNWVLATNISSELNTLAGAIPTAAVANLGAYVAGTNLTAITPGTNLTAVPASFADEAAVKTYLDTVVGEVETRLDAIDTATALIISQAETRLDAIDAQTALEVTKTNALLAALRTAGIVTP